jgi:hypothetical protein
MFVGHFGVGFAAKRAAPRTSLGSLFLAAQFIDLLWPIFLLVGLESVRIVPGITAVTPLEFSDYPLTHSLLGVVVWAVLFALVYVGLRQYPRGAWVLGFLVVSHWFLDLIVHRPDLPLAPGSKAVFGLGLWGSVIATIVVEGAILMIGLWLYLDITEAMDSIGRVGLAAFVVFVVVIWLLNIFGPPPPSVRALAWFANAQWLLILWGYWIDQHRAPATLFRP